MFESNKYLVQRKLFSIFGAEYYVLDEQGKEVLYAKQKFMKLREDLRIYTDKTKSEEVMNIKARNIIDFSAAYDVRDSKSNELIGTLKRKGMRSIIRDEWIVMNKDGKEIGSIIEDSMKRALFRRFFLSLFPQDFDYIVDGKKAADLKQRFNPFIYKMDVEILSSEADKRLALCAAILIALIEGRQDSFNGK